MPTFKTPDGKEINLSQSALLSAIPSQLQERIVEDGERWLSALKEALDTGKLPPGSGRYERQLENDAEEAFKKITEKMTPEQKREFLSALKETEATALLQRGNMLDMPHMHRMMEQMGFNNQEIETMKHVMNRFLHHPAISTGDIELFSQIYNGRVEQQLGLVHFGSNLSKQAKEQIEKKAWDKASIMNDVDKLQNKNLPQMENSIENHMESAIGRQL